MVKVNIKTVGELKEVLEKLDPDMGLDLIANCNMGRRYCTIKNAFYDGISIDVYTKDENNTLVINNSNSDDFYLDED